MPGVRSKSQHQKANKHTAKKASKHKQPPIKNLPTTQPSSAQPLNSRGLPSLPDELLLEVISYLPSIIPKPTLRLRYDPRGSGFGRRDALVCLSLLCRNLRRFALRYIYESIEVYSGNRIDRGVKSKSIILGGSINSGYVANKDFAVELMRQLDFVTKKFPELKDCVRVVSVELRSHCLKEVSEELFRCLPLFPNLEAIRLEVQWPTTDRIDPALFTSLQLPSVHTLILDNDSQKMIHACPNLKHLGVGSYGLDYNCFLPNHRLNVETLFVEGIQNETLHFVGLRKLIILCRGGQTLHDVLHELEFIKLPYFPRLQSFHILVEFSARRKTIGIGVMEYLEQTLRERQVLDHEDKYLCVEYRQPKLKRDYVQLKTDGTRVTDAALIRDMF